MKPLGCGHEFCWICLEDWKQHSKETGGYYKCNKYTQVELQDKNALKK